jgi:hypothetical protein
MNDRSRAIIHVAAKTKKTSRPFIYLSLLIFYLNSRLRQPRGIGWKAASPVSALLPDETHPPQALAYPLLFRYHIFFVISYQL